MNVFVFIRLTYDSGDHDQRHVGALVSVKYGMFRNVDAG